MFTHTHCYTELKSITLFQGCSVPLERLNCILLHLQSNKIQRQAVQKEKLVFSPGHWWRNALEICSIIGCFDLLERRAQEASLSFPSQHVEHVMHVMQICQSGKGGGGEGGLHCIP